MGPSFTWLKFVVTIGATIGLGSTILVLLYGQSRIFHAMARDGLLPSAFGSVNPKRRTPVVGTALTAIVRGLMAGLFICATYACWHSRYHETAVVAPRSREAGGGVC